MVKEDATVCDPGAATIALEGRVVTPTEAAGMDTISGVMAITGPGDVPDTTDTFGRGALEGFDGPKCGIGETTEEGLAIIERSHRGGVVSVSVLFTAYKACRSQIPKWRSSRRDIGRRQILSSFTHIDI
ncbi:hypothetical protein L208DRAFT_1382053 [Tricholoma matsutake]|nr:hypothetical protein L208DRAFT_1382053 [Tricholoma matsutake 945]